MAGDKRRGTTGISSIARRARLADLREQMFESLEQRALLASDLGVRFDETALQLPSRFVPGDRFLAPIEVINNGPDRAIGNVTINFYLSTNTSFDSGDLLIRSYQNEPINLPRYFGDPNDIGFFEADLRLPATAVPGTYFLLVRLLPNSQVGDFNSANNVAANEDATELVRKFGSFNGRTNVSMILQDPEGTLVGFSLSGGGSGEVSISPSGFVVTLTGTGNNSNVQITNSGGDGVYDFATVTIGGSVGTFNAPNARLTGPLTATVGFGAMTFGNVIGPATITVPNTSGTPSFSFGDVKDLNIDSPVGIVSLSAKSWTFTDGSRDKVTAPWIGALTVTSFLDLDLSLSGRDLSLPALGSVNVGNLRAATWWINGWGSGITVNNSTKNVSVTFNFRLDVLASTANLRGTFTARNIGQVNVARDLLGATIIAGAYLGADGVFGGVGANADIYRTGVLTSVVVGRNVANSTVGAGLSPGASGLFRDGDDRIIAGARSRIDGITVANVAANTTRFLAGVYGTIRIRGNTIADWRPDTRFDLSTTGPAAVFRKVEFQGSTASITVVFQSTSVMDRTRLANSIRVTGPNGFDQVATLQSAVFVAPQPRAAARAVFTLTLTDPGQYTLSVEPSSAPDDRNEFAIPGAFATFDFAG